MFQILKEPFIYFDHNIIIFYVLLVYSRALFSSSRDSARIHAPGNEELWENQLGVSRKHEAYLVLLCQVQLISEFKPASAQTIRMKH